jgi:hypothetical protein
MPADVAFLCSFGAWWGWFVLNVKCCIAARATPETARAFALGLPLDHGNDTLTRVSVAIVAETLTEGNSKMVNVYVQSVLTPSFSAVLVKDTDAAAEVSAALRAVAARNADGVQGALAALRLNLE